MAEEPFTFGIPLIARASAPDWALVEALLRLTLASVRAQTARGAVIVIAGHDRPEVDGPFEFLQADWDPHEGRAANLDSGRKKSLIGAHVLERGGGLLMLLDADDWVDTRTMACARREIQAGHVGGVIETGYATDIRGLRAVALPNKVLFDRGFDKLCGSSTIARLDPAAPSGICRDPYAILHEHYQWAEVCEAHGVTYAALTVAGNYVVNTAASHSETHGDFARWRGDFNRGVEREGFEADDGFLARFGLSRAAIDPVTRLIADRDVRARERRQGQRQAASVPATSTMTSSPSIFSGYSARRQALPSTHLPLLPSKTQPW